LKQKFDDADDADDARTKGSKPLPPRKRKIAVLLPNLPQEVVEIDSDSDARIQPVPSAASTLKGKVGSNAISSKHRVKPPTLSRPSCTGESSTSSSAPILTTPAPVSATTISTPASDIQVAVASAEAVVSYPFSAVHSIYDAFQIDPPAPAPTLTSTPDEVTPPAVSRTILFL
jgi:hypothetical protein